MGIAPGKIDTDGESIYVQGLTLGNVSLVSSQLLDLRVTRCVCLEKGHAPTHSFCNFYKYLQDNFRADVLLHYGTHGALEFMPGKQVGLSKSVGRIV